MSRAGGTCNQSILDAQNLLKHFDQLNTKPLTIGQYALCHEANRLQLQRA
jgi:hypothetical protein